METKIGYKVVTRCLHSVSVGLTSDLCVECKIGEWVDAPLKTMPIFLFSNHVSACTFQSENLGLHIYRCEYVLSNHILKERLFAYMLANMKKDLVGAYMQDYENVTSYMPNGTVFAQSVKLLERVG